MVKVNVERIIIGLLVLIVAVFVGFAISGIYKSEFLGFFAFSFLPAAFLVDLSVVVSYFGESESHYSAKLGWLVLATTLIIFDMTTTYFVRPGSYEDSHVIMGYTMSVLSFPSFFLIAYIYYGLDSYSDQFGLPVASEAGGLIASFIFWLACMVVGYLQWFKILPYLIERLKRLKKGGGQISV